MHRKIGLRSMALWLLAVVTGYGYVALILCERGQPFESGNNSLADFVALSLICFALFFTGPIHNIKAKEFSSWPLMLGLLVFVIPFAAALHWDFVGHTLGVHFSLTPHQLASLDIRSTLVLALAASGLAFGCILHLRWAYTEGILASYLSTFGAIVLVIAAISVAVSETHYLHFHHYCLGLLVFPFCRFSTPISVGCQAFFLGLAVEGVARWGMDPLWYFVA